MTCRMATGKQKKRLINSIDSDQAKPGKRPKFHSSNSLVTLNPHIGLKWDQNLRRAVPEKEQVGLLWSDLAPFVERPKHRSGLADVTYVSPETFSFENLRDMLSYEVWSTCLTEDERKFLMQFLPSDTDVEENVNLLLTGENFHFGNPFLSWSSSLCDGDIHPDAVLNKDKHIKSSEKAHRINLYHYHSNMVETLKKWRKKWLSCGDTENLFRDNPVKKKQGIVQVSASKGGMPLKVSQSVDVSKFMSYIEISTTQLNHIKRLKQSGDGIQIKHVSRVVGGLDKFPIKPIGALMEGEQIRLREHWLHMVHKDLPAAFEVIKDRKALMEKSRDLLGLELGEKNVSVMRKVKHSPQSILQGRNYQSMSLQEGDENTKYLETSICNVEGSNVKGLDQMVVNLTDITSQSKQISNALNQDCKYAMFEDVSISCHTARTNIADEQNESFTDIKLCKDGLDVQHDEITEVRYEDTTLQNCRPENQQIKSISCTRTHIHTLDSQNMQVHGQDLHGISNAILKHSNHDVNIHAEKRHPQLNIVTAGREEAENIVIIPSCSSSVLPKYSGEHILVEDFLDSNNHVEGVKDKWHMGGPRSYYHPSENRTYKDSDGLLVTQRYFSSGQQNSKVYTNSSVLGQQPTQVTTSVFPMDNSASFIEPVNQQSNSNLQRVKDIGRISYSHQHVNIIEQSIPLHSSTNNHLTESSPFPSQEHQLIDQSGLCVQQLDNNLYSGLMFPNSGNPPVAQQHPYPAFALTDHRYNNWSLEGDQMHNNNLSGLELGDCLTQTLPSVSSTDGSLFSAIAQYRRTSVNMEPRRSNSNQLPVNQVVSPHNFVPASQDTNPPLSSIYNYTQNMASSTNNHVASIGPLNNMNWTNFIQQNPGMPDLTGRLFRGPWTR